MADPNLPKSATSILSLRARERRAVDAYIFRELPTKRDLERISAGLNRDYPAGLDS